MGISLEFSRYHAVGHLKMRSSLQFQIISHVPFGIWLHGTTSIDTGIPKNQSSTSIDLHRVQQHKTGYIM